MSDFKSLVIEEVDNGWIVRECLAQSGYIDPILKVFNEITDLIAFIPSYYQSEMEISDKAAKIISDGIDDAYNEVGGLVERESLANVESAS